MHGFGKLIWPDDKENCTEDKIKNEEEESLRYSDAK